MSQELNYLGVPIFFAGKTWYMPSLSVAQFKMNYDVLMNPEEGTSRETVERRFALYVPIIGMALRRNYPNLTDEQLWDDLDLNTFTLALRAVQNATGLTPVRAGHEADPN